MLDVVFPTFVAPSFCTQIDILLLAPSITELQLLVSTCETYLSEIDVNIKVDKSNCIRFGSRFNRVCENSFLVMVAR
jgi:hypothetical protein